MTNLRGVLMINSPPDQTTGTNDLNKVISSLGIITPFTISARIRWKIINRTSDDHFIGLYCKWGGSSNDFYHLGSLNSNDQGPMFTHMRCDAAIPSANYAQTIVTAYTYEGSTSWYWLQISVDETGLFTVKVKKTEDTDIPSSWDYQHTDQCGLFTAEDILQEVGMYTTSRDNTASIVTHQYVEIDEIHVVQD